ncbi:MAG TPA: LysM peptidoglycan-binding domain-containing protein [Candidatus Acidoferrales bacterium]|nr:LysM peptidoglycan-binding domain-containing protein [Candidatus Acidoferrales bacterium]
MLPRLAIVATFIVAACGVSFAQSDYRESNPAPYSPPARVVRPAAPAPEERAVEPATEDETRPAAPKPSVRPDHPANVIPYTVRPGDSMGQIAQMFGITPEELAKANRIHPDEELMADQVLKVPHPFTTEVNTLKSQVETLSAQLQAAQQKSDAAEEQVKSQQAQVQELTGDNQDMQLSLKILPWWRATAVSVALFALIMFGVMALTLFEWWRTRRRFVALAEMTDALSRLDHKYKTVVAKAELRLQQLYGRRRGGITEGQPRPRMPEEIEIERLNEELKEILALHLQRMGARLPGVHRRRGWRDLFGGDVAAEPRTVRR